MAKQRIKISVTERDIKDGKPNRCLDCPIALASKRAAQDTARVDSDLIRFCRRWFKLPKAAKRFIARFDSGKRVKPFTFTAVEE